MPAEYQPPYFKACDKTYIFKEKPIDYVVGSIVNVNHLGAMVFDIKSVYVSDVLELEDALMNDAGTKVNERIDPMDITADSGVSEESVRVILEPFLSFEIG